MQNWFENKRFLNKGSKHYLFDEYYDTIVCCELVLAEHNNIRASYLKGSALSRLGRHEDVLRCFNHARVRSIENV